MAGIRNEEGEYWMVVTCGGGGEQRGMRMLSGRRAREGTGNKYGGEKRSGLIRIELVIVMEICFLFAVAPLLPLPLASVWKGINGSDAQ